MNSLARRLGTAAVLTIPLAWLLFWAPERVGALGFYLFASVVFVVGAWETTDLLSRIGYPSYGRFLLAAVALYVVVLWLPDYVPLARAYPEGAAGTLLALCAVFCISLSISVVTSDVEQGWPRALGTLGTFVYAGVLAGSWIAIRRDFGGLHTAQALMLVWMVDSGAMFAGKLFGRTKLSPIVSPNKTVEGLVGGIVFAAAVTMGVKALGAGFPGTYGQIAALALVLGCVGHLGDLSESLLKRKAGVKDSSNLLPGHGGILDKLDALLFAGPVYYIVARWMLNAS